MRWRSRSSARARPRSRSRKPPARRAAAGGAREPLVRTKALHRSARGPRRAPPGSSRRRRSRRRCETGSGRGRTRTTGTGPCGTLISATPLASVIARYGCTTTLAPAIGVPLRASTAITLSKHSGAGTARHVKPHVRGTVRRAAGGDVDHVGYAGFPRVQSVGSRARGARLPQSRAPRCRAKACPRRSRTRGCGRARRGSRRAAPRRRTRPRT